MTAKEAEDILRRNGIDPYLYNVGEPRLAECYVLREDAGKWVTYEWEKGQRNDKKVFDTEDAASRFFLEKVTSIASMVAGHPRARRSLASCGDKSLPGACGRRRDP